MNFNLKSKVAIIGGASKGLGKACAVSLAKEGVNVVICARNKRKLDETAIEIKKLGVDVLAVSGDMSSNDDNVLVVEKTLEKFGRIDILINNSGGPKAGTFSDINEDEFISAFESVLLYVYRMNKLVIPHMAQNKFGRIINITSLSVKEPAPSLLLSNVFRSGVVAMSRSMTKELIKDNITTNNICPGAFKTDRAIELMGNAAIKQNKTIEDIEEAAIAKLPQDRKSTRLNSSHVRISYAVFCLKKKKKKK